MVFLNFSYYEGCLIVNQLTLVNPLPNCHFKVDLGDANIGKFGLSTCIFLDRVWDLHSRIKFLQPIIFANLKINVGIYIFIGYYAVQ